MRFLSWLAGIFWLILAVIVHVAAVGLMRLPGTWHFALVWRLLVVDEFCGNMALACAKEAGLV